MQRASSGAGLTQFLATIKTLIDECIDQKLHLLFAGHDCQTSAFAKLAGLKNGVLLTAAGSAGFELMITTDQEIPYQQNLGRRKIVILILCAPTNRLADRVSVEYLLVASPWIVRSQIPSAWEGDRCCYS